MSNAAIYDQATMAQMIALLGIEAGSSRAACIAQLTESEVQHLSFKPHGQKELRKKLDRARRLAGELLKILPGCDIPALYVELIPGLHLLPAIDYSLSCLKERLDELLAKPSGKGRPVDLGRRNFIKLLAGIYRQSTGSNPTVSYDVDTGQPSGLFFYSSKKG